jgi:predicted nuclease of predicted toxin-antitoxin system
VSVALYMDVHVPAPITRALFARGVDVLTVQADGTTRMEDSKLLDRARELGRVMFSRDEDFLAEATARQRKGDTFAGLIYAHQLRVTIGRCVQDLELIAKCSEPEDFLNRIEHLPLR